jgi:phosphate transport system substrate-binding protein
MNDEFLHRIRKAPPPEFLAALKARLDRQSPAPAPRRRWAFTRGLITGLLLGGAAFALTAVSLTRGPESLRSLVRTPAEYFARLMRGSGQEEDKSQTHGQHQAAPLGPVWLPNRATGPSGQAPTVPTQSTGFAVKQDDHSGPVGSKAPVAGSSIAAGGSGFPAFEAVKVLASQDAYPIARVTANDVPRFGYHMTVELDTGNPFGRLCNTDSTAPVDAVELSRRITPDELSRCTRGGVTRLVEVKIGYQAITLARARLYGPMRLTARDLFLALARKIPDPARPGKFINNPNTTWNQVDGALPYDRIQVIGPATGSTAGKLAAHLLLQAGCDSYPGIVAIRDSDPGGYEDICGNLRGDGSYVQSTNSAGWAYFDELATNPTALGILRLNDPSRALNNLLLTPVDSAEPTQAAVAAGTYPVAETLYLYANKSRLLGNQAFNSIVRSSLAPRFLQQDTWAFVPLDSAERERSLANGSALKELQF